MKGGKQLVLSVAVPHFYLGDHLTPEFVDEFYDGNHAAALWDDLRIANPNIKFDLDIEGEKMGDTVTVEGRVFDARVGYFTSDGLEVDPDEPGDGRDLKGGLLP